MKNVITPLAKSVLLALGLTAAADTRIHKKTLGSRTTTLIITATLIIWNDEMEDIMKIVKSFNDSGLLLKGVNESIQNEEKEQKEGFLFLIYI